MIEDINVRPKASE